MKFFIFISLFVALSSCGKKESGKGQSNNLAPQISNVEENVFDINQDSDGDGITDNEEVKNGTDRLIADIPKLDNQLFKELLVTMDFYNKSNNSFKTEKFTIKNEKIELSWQKETEAVANGGLYMDSLLKSYAINSKFAKNGFRFKDYNEGVFSLSSPIIYENSLLNISRRILNYKREGFEVKQTRAKILAKILVSSNRFKHFTQPVFDIYYKSKDREDLIFIESQVIEGITYEFNKEVEIYFDFESFDNTISNQALLAGGASFFIKLRDFYIYENGLSYSGILRDVKSKSIPVTASYPDGENGNSRFETIYVGLQGGVAKMSTILKTAFKNDILMTNSSIDVVRGFNNNRRAYGQTGENETLRWFIGSSSVDDNVFSHNYEAGDGIGLAYLSDKKTQKKPIYISKSIINNSQQVNLVESLPSNTKNIKIRIEPLMYQIPVEFKTFVSLENCQYDGNRYYNRTDMKWDSSLSSFNKFVKMGNISIFTEEGDILSAKVGDLINNKLLTQKEIENNIIEIELSQKVIDSLPQSDIQPQVKISMNPNITYINLGHMEEIKNNCTRITDRNPGGCPKCSQKLREDLMTLSSSSSSIQSSAFEDQFDANVFVISY